MEIYNKILHRVNTKKKIFLRAYFSNEGKMTRSLLEHPVYNISFTLYTFNQYTYINNFVFLKLQMLLFSAVISYKIRVTHACVYKKLIKLLNSTNIVLTYTDDSISCIIYLARTLNFCCIVTLKNKNSSTSSGFFFLLVQILVIAFRPNANSTLYHSIYF